MQWEKPFSMIILAGGKSSRMGRDKADLCLEGKTFLQIQIEKGRQLGIRDIQVSGYRGRGCEIPVTPDRVPGKGPLGGLETCLRLAKEEQCLVLSVDAPLVPVQELEGLLRASLETEAPVTVLRQGDREQPLVAVYRRSLADAMLEEITVGKGSVFALLNRVGYSTYSCACPQAAANVNTPQAYQALLNSVDS